MLWRALLVLVLLVQAASAQPVLTGGGNGFDTAGNGLTSSGKTVSVGCGVNMTCAADSVSVSTSVVDLDFLETREMSFSPVQEWTGGASNLDLNEINDWAPTGIQTSTFIVTRGADNDGTRITGIDSTGINVGDVRYFVNLPYGLEPPLDSGTITFLHEDSRSLEANRIQTPGAVECTIPMYAVVGFVYGGLDGEGTNRWRMMSDCGRSSHAMVQRLQFFPSCAVGDAGSPVTGTFNDYRPTCNTPWTPGYLVAGGTTDSYDYTTMRIYAGGGGMTITGLYAGPGVGTMQALGGLKFVQNVGTGDLTLLHNSGSSSVSMRLFLPRGRDLVLGPNEGVWLFSTYHNNIDNAVANWYAIGLGNEEFPSITTDGTTDLGGALELSGITSPSTLASGTTNNYDPGSRNAVWRLAAHTSGSTLSGIAAPTLNDHELHIIQNASTGTLTFTNLDSGSSVGNRFATPRSLPLTIPGNGSVIVRYDWDDAHWVFVSWSGGDKPVTYSSSITANCIPVFTDTNGTQACAAITDDGSFMTFGTGRILTVPASTTFSNGVAFGATLAAFAPSWSGRLPPTAITSGSDTNNWNPTGLHTRLHIAVQTSTSSLATITGMDATSADGELKTLCNYGPGPVKIVNESGSSTAGNRFWLASGTDVTLPDTANQVHCIAFRYDSSDARWQEQWTNFDGRNPSAPSAGTCGTGPTFSTNSTNDAFTVTTGTGATACTITFGSSGYTNAPTCVVSAQSGTQPVYSVSTTALTMSTAAASATYDVICRGH